MTPAPISVVQVQALLATSTPGRWVWHGHSGDKAHGGRSTSIHLGSWVPGLGVCSVMSFMRSGMQGATVGFYGMDDPTSWPKHRTPAKDLAIHEVEYRDDIVGIDHPDATLIASARAIAELAVAQADLIDELQRKLDSIEVTS